MKRFSLWFAVAFVLFSFQGGYAKPTQAQLDSLEAMQPVLVTTPNLLRYDSLGFSRGDGVVGDSAFLDSMEYRIAVRFTVPPDSLCSLQVVYFQIDNSYLNLSRGCYIWIYDNGANQRPGAVLDSFFVGAALPNTLRSESTSYPIEFDENRHFWIVLGPVPGGEYRDSIGAGWWGLHDLSVSRGRSFIQFGDNPTTWDSLGAPGLGAGNWIIRAGVTLRQKPPEVVVNEIMFNSDRFSSDFTRNHEWVELYNSGKTTTTQGWKILRGDEQNISIRNDINFPESTYLVVHVVNTLGAPDSLDADFSDGRGDYFVRRTSLPDGGFFGDRKDACALFIPGFPTVPPGYASLIAWNLTNLSVDSSVGVTTVEAKFKGRDSSRAVRLVSEDALGPLLSAGAGVSIGRDSLGTDSSIFQSHRKDVELLGGPHAAGPTMGRKNRLEMVIDNWNIDSTPVPGADRTLMLYFASDNGEGAAAQERWCYDLLNQIERVIAEPRIKVNVVVWFDSRNAFPKTIPSDKGKVFRGVLKQDSTDTVKNLLPVGDLNSGDSASLRGFISWAKERFSASSYVLVLKGDGAGWQGLCGDADSSDRLDMGDLKSAFKYAGLDTAKLDLLLFDAPLMSQLEVAYQVRNFAHTMVASPEMTGPADFDYSRLVGAIQGGTLSAASVLAGDTIIGILNGRLRKDRPEDREGNWIWSAIHLDNFQLLFARVRQLALNLKKGVAEKCSSGISTDNFQLYIRQWLTNLNTDHYGGQAQGMADFVDLKRISNLLSQNFPACSSQYKDAAGGIDTLLKTEADPSYPASPVLIGQSQLVSPTTGRHYGSGGISIYFPSSRQRSEPIDAARKNRPRYKSTSDHSFDTTGLMMETGGIYAPRLYAADSSCYPHVGDSCGQYGRSTDYPHPALSDFDFVDSTAWDEFLIRYYKPVADGGLERQPGNLAQPLTLDASGTSDADDEPSSLRYFWDLNPFGVSSGDCDSTEKEDLDKNCVDDFTDDRDTTGKNVNYRFLSSGKRTAWLHVWDAYDGSLSGTNRGYQTGNDDFVVDIEHRGVYLVYETPTSSPIHDVYDQALDRLDPAIRCSEDLPTEFDRNNLTVKELTEDSLSCPSVIWTTAVESTTTFPSRCRDELDSVLVTDSMNVWVLGRLVGKDSVANYYFKNKGFPIDSARTAARYLESAGGAHFLAGLPRLELDTTSGIPQLMSLKDTTCPIFPILVTDVGKTVAAAKVVLELDGGKHAIVLSTFGLEQLAGNQDIDLLMGRVMGWLSNPEIPETCTACPIPVKGDFDNSGTVEPGDVVCELNCFVGLPGSCNCEDICVSDMNCDGNVTPADIVVILNVFATGIKGPC